MGLTTREAACDAQTKNLSDLFRSTSAMSQDECSELFEYLEADNNTFTKDQRTPLAKLANTRCESLANQNTTGSDESNQKNLYVQFYYPAWMWAIIKSDDIMHNKIINTADFWIKHLGIRFACEKTKRLGISILHVAANLPVDPDLAYEHLHELQAVIVAKRSIIPGSSTLKVFPQDPNDFWNQYPDAYSKEHPPVSCRICDMAIFHRNTKTCIPARSSNNKIKAKHAKHTAPHPIMNTSNESWKDQMLKFMFDKQAISLPPIHRSIEHRPLPDAILEPKTETHAAPDTAIHHASTFVGGEIKFELAIPGKPDDVGGLPGVFKALAPAASASEAMAKIRADIASAVAKCKAASGKKAKNKRKKILHPPRVSRMQRTMIA